jgi:hypothetical protein
VLRLLVARLPQPDLRLEALALVERVVQLGERVGDLAAGDHQLEPLDQPRVAALRLRQRRQLARVVRDEDRLLEVRLDQLLEQLVEQLRPAQRRGVLDAEPRARRGQLGVVHRAGVDTAVLLQRVEERQPAERRREVERAPGR